MVFSPFLDGMRIVIDKSNILTIENPNIPKLKKYDNIASGYCFSDYDKWVLVYHKKEIKIINLKNLWNTMNIFYVIKRSLLKTDQINKKWFELAFKLFNWFDENSGNTYYFIPRIKESEVWILNQNLIKLWIDIKIEKNEKWFVVNKIWWLDDSTKELSNIESIDELISFLFATILIYGKMEIKNWDLISIKIHIPLLGQYIKYKEQLDNIINTFKDEGMFLNRSTVWNNDWITYQISSSDYEILSIFADFYQSIEKIQKILKQDFTEKVKSELLDFVENNEQIPADGKEEVMELIEDGMLKILTV